MKAKKRKCNCETCKLSPKLRKFEKSLSPKQNEAFREIFDAVWNRMEMAEMDLGVIEAKIEGTWPKHESDGGVYFTRVGKNLYEVRSTKVKNVVVV
jgi:hypothetical protein